MEYFIIVLVIVVIVVILVKPIRELNEAENAGKIAKKKREKDIVEIKQKKIEEWGFKKGTIEFSIMDEMSQQVELKHFNFSKSLQKPFSTILSVKIVRWGGSIDSFKDSVAKMIKCFSEIIIRYDNMNNLTISNIRNKTEKPQFPILFTFYTEIKFHNNFGEEFYGANNEASISLDNLRQIKDGFHGKLLHLTSRVEISKIPIHSSSLTFEERIEPRLINGNTKKRKKVNDKRHIPSSVRREVWRRDQGRCVNCGSREKLEYDHIIPVSKGGSTTARNVELLCQDCNREKSNKIT